MVGKTAFLFPGQGSQKFGMGQDLFGSVYFDAMEEAGIPIHDILQDKERVQQDAAYAIYGVSGALAQELVNKGVDPDFVLGFSLGEIVAMGFCGYLTLEDALAFIKVRTDEMQQASTGKNGGMIAVNQVPRDVLEALQTDFPGVTLANYNSPLQTVISGEKETLNAFVNALGRGKAIPLAVNGAFHSPMMHSATDALRAFFQEHPLQSPNYPAMSNRTGLLHAEDLQQVTEDVIHQVESPVLFETMVRNAYDDGVRTFVEVGEGKTLNGLVKRILPDADICLVQIRNLDDVGAFVAARGENNGI